MTLAIPDEVKELLADFSPISTKNQPYTSLCLIDDFPVFVVSTTVEAWGAALIFYTGPPEFKQCICSDAMLQGYKLNKSGLWMRGIRYAGRTEKQVFDCLGLPYVIPPERKAYFTEERRKMRDARKVSGKTSSLRFHRFTMERKKRRRLANIKRRDSP